jgi:hypothetical protein
VNSGYRAQVTFRVAGRADTQGDCLFDFAGAERAFDRDGEKWLPLGVEDVAVITPFDVERMSEIIVAGAAFEVFEGRTPVGTGRVLEPLARQRLSPSER